MSSRPKRSTRSANTSAAALEAEPRAERELRDKKSKKSSRKRKRNDSEEDFNADSEEEFEKLMQRAEEEEDERLAKKKKKKEDKLKREQQFQEDHQDFCDICQQGGEIILCDGCPKAYHKICLDVEDIPDGTWYCTSCVENGVPDQDSNGKKEKDQPPGNMDNCLICKEGGFLLCCESCPNSYHAYCLTPPLEELPDQADPWHCPFCTVEETAHKPHKVISWRWKTISYPDPVDPADLPKEGENQEDIDEERMKRLMMKPPRKMEPRKERELFIKWKNLSYYHSTWVPELPLQVHHRIFLSSYWRLNGDAEHPPENDDGSTDAETGNVADQEKETDTHDLEKRFYRYGVKPEWMQPARIINHHQAGHRMFDYLIKWTDLSYDNATWEADDMDIPNFMNVINKYWTHRELMTNEKIPKSVLKKIEAWRAENDMPTWEEEKKKKIDERKKKYDISKKYEEQPQFILDTGGKLHPYQMEGINWLRHCWSQDINAILADEMGLGKTVQALTFLYSLYKEGHADGPFLVAAPLSTIINWEREAEFWAPDFYVVTYSGHKEARAVIREHEITFEDVKSSNKATKIKGTPKFHVLLTSYECINVDKTTLSNIKWGALVVDEAHRLKNSQSLFFRNLSEYDIAYTLLLTGTPLQNNLEELFHLLNFLSPNEFTNCEEFTSEFTDISKEDQVSKLHSMLGPHMLRRLKADVLTGMPSKSELIVCVDMVPYQKRYYKSVLTKNYDALNVKGGGRMVSLSNVLMELKKCCNHPYLFPKAEEEAPKTKTGAYEGEALIKNCAKLELLAKMLKKLKAGGHRVLIFSQMTRLLDILEEFCDHLGYRFERIDGSITGQLRQESIDRFNAANSEHFVFLLSTRAGGLGINLATADTVIIYDSDWNPHNDIQAFSRAHRLGQRNHVMIYRFVTRNSVEERITTVAKKKMLLTHLAIRNNSKQTQMSKSELDDVLRWGTEELFKEEEDEQNKIVWDDEAVDALLQRAGEADPETGEKKDWANDYLSSFKVAQYVTKEKDEKDITEEEAKEILEEKPQAEDADYWERLLRHHHENEVEQQAAQLGKGKRVRRQVNYAADHMDYRGKKDQENDDDYNASSDEDGTGESGHGSGDEDEQSLRRKKEKDEKLPPLLTRSQGQVEVLGFNPRQRKAFFNAVMRYGMPPPDAYNSQWLVKDLKCKSEKAFKAYASLFMRHLCEPGSDHIEHFNDGVPREGLNRQHVLARIGIMSLIRKKVQEFQEINGVWSIPEEADKQLADCLITLGLQEDEEKESSVQPSEKDGSQEPDAVKTETKEASVKSEGENGDEMEVENNENAPVLIEKEPQAKEEISENGDRKRAVAQFKFNVCDGGFTELHTIWKEEETMLKKNGQDYDVWNRRHDYWLLAGFSTHGYGRYTDIFNDARFSLLNEAFKNEKDKPNFNELRMRFVQRRYKLIEQSLIIEEQLRRANNISYGQKPREEKPHVLEEEKKEEVKKEDSEVKVEEKNGEDVKNGEPEKEKEESEDKEPETSTKSEVEKTTEELEKKYVQITSLADANQGLAKEAFAGNKNAALVLHKVLSQLEDILNDMKADVSRLPASVAQLPSVAERLELSERTILNRLTTKDTRAYAGESPIPPPGPFATPVQLTRFSGVQPKFAALVSNLPARTPSYGLPPVISVDEKNKETKPIVPASNGTTPTVPATSENGTPVPEAKQEKPTENNKETSVDVSQEGSVEVSQDRSVENSQERSVENSQERSVEGSQERSLDASQDEAMEE
ncbi:unnamed protein product [Bursaphelenchus okinawaensis]|uniref:Uncharacterized protein n=1 Tax=Bursaphelenchus okinawaensis TaxID=465554 RepID=A0A811L9Z6_9BILA|nr:unnamed protein product [Bursaphelenchus okinawaensis]CAG9119295.1 unnamed protein product [Bursaphelenchus okinawaensis]